MCGNKKRTFRIRKRQWKKKCNKRNRIIIRSKSNILCGLPTISNTIDRSRYIVKTDHDMKRQRSRKNKSKNLSYDRYKKYAENYSI